MTSRPRHGGQYRRLIRLSQKELKETLRDRRTIITLLLMPLLVYPILSMALNRFVLTAGEPGQGFSIGVASGSELNQLDRWISDPRSLPPDAIRQSSHNQLAEFRGVLVEGMTAEAAVEQNIVDLGAVIERIDSATPSVTLFAYRGDVASEAARRVLVERLQWLRLADARAAIDDRVPGYTEPVEIHVADLGEPSQESMLATIVPLVLVLMTITGAVYPAIDLTAGERERGTMESVMASPVSRTAVLFSKYVAVVVVALLTAVVNLAAMFATLWAGGLMPMLTGNDHFPWIAALRILGLLLLFSGFYSAVMLSLTSFARSFKEAQSYLIPVMLVSLAPAMLSLIPGASLRSGLAILPLINIVLLARDLLAGTVDPVGAVTAVVSTITYATAALLVAANLFGKHAVERTSERSIGSLFRRPIDRIDVPSPQAAALMLALLIPIYFVLSNGLIRFLERFREVIEINSQLTLNAAALIASFGLVPLLAAILERSRLRTTYRLAVPGLLTCCGAVLVGLGAWAFAHESFVVAEGLGIGGLNEERMSAAQAAVAKMRQASPILLLTVFAVAPAIIEELCFRGYLFASFRAVMSPARTIVVTALLFGLFHVLTGSALLIERFVPSTLMGLIIGWVAWRSASVLPGMVVHFVHNSLLMMVLYYGEHLNFLAEGFDNQSHLPLRWIVGAGALLTLGIALVATGKGQIPNPSSKSI